MWLNRTMTTTSDTSIKEIAARIAELSEGSKWGEADYLVEIFPVAEWGAAKPGPHSGIHGELKQISSELVDVYGVERKPEALARERAAAITYPPSERALGASFSVHVRCPDPSELRKHLRRVEREGKGLSVTRLARYRQDDQAKKGTLAPLDERLTTGVLSRLKAIIFRGGRIIKRDDWWNSGHVTDEQRQTMVNVLRAVADRIAG